MGHDTCIHEIADLFQQLLHEFGGDVSRGSGHDCDFRHFCDGSFDRLILNTCTVQRPQFNAVLKTQIKDDRTWISVLARTIAIILILTDWLSVRQDVSAQLLMTYHMSQKAAWRPSCHRRHEAYPFNVHYMRMSFLILHDVYNLTHGVPSN